MRVLVTGGAGFIGSHLVEKLVKQYNEVVVLDDLSSGTLKNLVTPVLLKMAKDPILSFHNESVCDLAQVKTAAKDCGVIIHLATQCLVKGLENPELMHQVNVVGTFNVCMAAKENNSKIVFIGTSEEYGPQIIYPIKETSPLNPVSIYGQTKIVAEQYVHFFNRVYGVPAVCIRPFNTYGPRQREDGYAGAITSFMKRIEAGKPPIIYGDGLQTRDFSYVTDIIDGILLLPEYFNSGEVLNLGSGREVSLLELIKIIYDAMGVEPMPPIFESPRINDLRRLRADISLAWNHGYEPKISLEEGIKKYAEWRQNEKRRDL